MRKYPDDKLRKIEEVLIAARRGRGEVKPDDTFARNVMSRVRQTQALSSNQIGNGMDFRNVWRFAFVTSVMALIILACSLDADFSGIQFAESVAGDPSTIMLVETFAPI